MNPVKHSAFSLEQYFIRYSSERIEHEEYCGGGVVSIVGPFRKTGIPLMGLHETIAITENMTRDFQRRGAKHGGDGPFDLEYTNFLDEKRAYLIQFDSEALGLLLDIRFP